MKYRVTCLTPLLVGDGRKLSPIDYMVWRDQVNVLDQQKIFRLLAKGPRLDSYLTQLKRADKLDFASWGGFAQNFADRRIPFEHSSCTGFWERALGESLFIPTFAAGQHGPYLPGSALKGALRTGLLFSRWEAGVPEPVLAQFDSDRIPRRPAEMGEARELGASGTDLLRPIGVDDSAPVDYTGMKVYLLRVSTLLARGQGKLELGWKAVARPSVEARQVDTSAPYFVEMAQPGTIFEGNWRESAFFSRPEVRRDLRWKETLTGSQLMEAVNKYAARLLSIHRKYAETAGLPALAGTLGQLESRLVEIREGGNRCLLPLGWGGGILGKSAIAEEEPVTFRRILRQIPLYSRTLATGLPFPKTRRIVFQNNQPASLPGWVLFELQ